MYDKYIIRILVILYTELKYRKYMYSYFEKNYQPSFHINTTPNS